MSPLVAADRRTQADALRAAGRTAAPATTAGDGARPLVLVCASGRGGSGTTLTSLLVAFAAAGEGIRTTLLDADELTGPVALHVGLDPAWRWRDLRHGIVRDRHRPTRVATTLAVIAGGRGADDDGAPLGVAERRTCLRRALAVAQPADLIVVDAGAHADTALAALDVDPFDTRLLAVIGDDDGVALAATHALCKVVHQRRPQTPLALCVARRDATDAARIADTLADGARRFLQRPLPLAGVIPADPTLVAALRRGMPIADAVGGSPAALAALDLVLGLRAEAASIRRHA